MVPIVAGARISGAGVPGGATAILDVIAGETSALGETGRGIGHAQSTADWNVVRRAITGKTRKSELAAVALGTGHFAFEAVAGVAF